MNDRADVVRRELHIGWRTWWRLVSDGVIVVQRQGHALFVDGAAVRSAIAGLRTKTCGICGELFEESPHRGPSRHSCESCAPSRHGDGGRLDLRDRIRLGLQHPPDEWTQLDETTWRSPGGNEYHVDAAVVERVRSIRQGESSL